jgi:hypothetical protein
MLSFRFLLANVNGETGVLPVVVDAEYEDEAYDIVYFIYGDNVEIVDCSVVSLIDDKEDDDDEDKMEYEVI